MSTDDRYREWDAAYVMGSLAPTERREFEQHLAGCPECSAAVAALAGLSGPLAAVPREQAFALLDEGGSQHDGGTPSVLPALTARVERERRRARWRTALVAAAAAVVAAAVALGVSFGLRSDDAGPAGPSGLVAMQPVGQSPITADAKLVAGPWGTRIEAVCRYASRPGGDSDPHAYAMYVTDVRGRETQVASWTAAPGSALELTATTRVPKEQIAEVDIRYVGKREVVLLTTSP